MTEKKVVQRRPRNVATTPDPQVVKAVDTPTTMDFVHRTDLGFIDGPVRRNACIGIDQSVNGYAIAAYCPDDGTSTIWLFKNPVNTKRALAGMKRMLALERFVETTFNNLKVRCPEVLHICMEGYNRNARNWREEAGELSWMTRRTLLRVFGITNMVAYPTLVAPLSLQKYVVGTGKSMSSANKKALMLKAVYQKWDLDVSDDNVADAYGLARMAAAIVTGQTAHQYEHEIVAKIGRHTEWDPQEPPKTRSRSSVRAKTQSSG